MKLQEYRVREFRSIKGSGPIAGLIFMGLR